MSDKPANKIKARLPRGFADRGPAELRTTREMIEKIRAVYERYGFEAVETPAIEYTDVLGKFLPDQDRPNEGVFSFQDDDKRWLSLRYDLTAPLARYVAENSTTLLRPYRSYRVGWVFRNEKPGPGRYRQFMQFDADTVGAASVAADAEMCMMAADTMEALGIKRGDYVIKVNNRKMLDGIRETAKIIDDAQWLIALRAIDKLNRLGVEEVQKLLGQGRKDESGDFTKGAGLNDVAISRIINFTGSGKAGSGAISTVGSNEVTIANFEKAVEGSKIGEEGTAELLDIKNLIAAAGYDDGRILIDPSVVRGLEYYTGPVYEADLTFETKDEKGKPVRFGSIGGGGRYDSLIARFRSEPVPATGFSIGVSRLLAALQTLNKVDSEPEFGPVVVTVFNKEFLAHSHRILRILHKAKIRSELYIGDSKSMGIQLKYADKRRSPCAIIQGPDELKTGMVQIKDLAEGKKASAFIQSNEEWRQSRAAQSFVREDELVQEIGKLFARYGIKHGH
jgi:histidyl-tRNA synthetase